MAPIPTDYYMNEKDVPLGVPVTSAPLKPRSGVRRALRGLVVGAVLLAAAHSYYPEALVRSHDGLLNTLKAVPSEVADVLKPAEKSLCPQQEVLVPRAYAKLYEDLGFLIKTGEYKEKAVKWLADAVKVPTESYDKMAPPGEDKRWEAFGLFHDYLLNAFPLVHKTFSLTKVNTYGLVYEWAGSETSLKPLLLMAHQDVVPVDPTTVDKWAHPPYSGHYDGERIWGRGSMDDKSGLIGIMTTLETLIEKGFKPSRGIVLSFGFDEEASGTYGAQANADALLARYGENAFELIVDEGGGFAEMYGGTFAVPGIAEKGYLDVRVDMHSPGGHSSIPPPHTSIGILSQLLVAYESHPYTPRLARSTPIYATIQCLAAHAPDLSHSLRKQIKKSVSSDKALKQAERELLKIPMFAALVGTTQAIDLIQGGVKSNALPEQAWAVVNHRIDTASSVSAVKKHDTALLRKLAHKFNLTYTAFGEQLSKQGVPAYGTLELSDAWGTALEPAPITPIEGKPFALLAGTIRSTYARHRGTDPVAHDDQIVVAPGIMTGNTDTRYYWALSEHIFRYSHYGEKGREGISGVHTVNESIVVDGFLEMILFFHTLILNTDEARF